MSQNKFNCSIQPANDTLDPVIRSCIKKGFNVMMFPEGTSTDSLSVLPFKSSLFERPRQASAYIQPASLIYRDRQAGQLTDKDRQFHTRGTDAPFFNHFLNLILRPGVWVEVWIRESISPQKNRKQLTQIAQSRIHALIRHRVDRQSL